MSAAARFTFFTAFIVAAVASLDNNAVTIALPNAARELGNIEQMGGVITAFLLAAMVTAPLYGKASDVYGRRRVLSVAIALFMLGSTLCCFAGSMTQLVAFRALQGAGAGGLFTTAITMVADSAPPHERTGRQSIILNAVTMCQLIGPLLGGFLTEHFSWRAVFLLNPVMGAVALAMLWLGAEPPRSDDTSQRHLNLRSAALLTLSGLFAIVALANTSHGFLGWAPYALAATAAIALFLLTERASNNPIVPLKSLSQSNYRISTLALAALAFSLQGSMAFTPLFLQTVFGFSPLHSGLVLLAQIFGMTLSGFALRSSTFVSIAPQRMVAAGICAECIGLFGLITAAALHIPPAFLIIALVFRGFGAGVSIPHLMTIAQNAAPQAALGAATSTMMFVRSFGGVIGVTASSILISVAAADASDGPAGEFALAFQLIFALHALATICALALTLRAFPRTSH